MVKNVTAVDGLCGYVCRIAIDGSRKRAHLAVLLHIPREASAVVCSTMIGNSRASEAGRTMVYGSHAFLFIT